MNDIEIRLKILKILYQALRENPGIGSFPFKKIMEDISVDEKIFNFNMHYLINHGFVRFHGFGHIVIEHEGVRFMEGPSVFNPSIDFEAQSITVTGGSVGQIVQIHDFINPSVLFEQLNSAIETHPEIPPEKKNYWKSFVKEIPRKILDQLIASAIQEAGRRVGL